MIDADTLANDLVTCLHLASHQVTPPMIERQIERIRREGSAVTANTAPSRALRALVQRNVERMLLEERAQMLAQSLVYVVPLPLCAAYSKPDGQIVIGNGLMNVLSACGYWAFLCEQLPAELMGIRPLPRFPSLSAWDAVSLYLFALIFRHYRYGEPLPDLRAWITPVTREEIDVQVKHSVAGAATFILLHEMGHIALSHHVRKDTLLPADFALSVEQSLSEYQIKEFEADDFAMASLRETLRALHLPWINMALNFHVQRETMLGERAPHHPISINRLSHAFSRRDGVPTGRFDQSHLVRMSEAFVNIERNSAELRRQNRAALLDAMDREMLLSDLAILDRALARYGMPLAPVLDTKSELADWTTCLL